jgi:hypothetical protein
MSLDGHLAGMGRGIICGGLGYLRGSELEIPTWVTWISTV